jgi:hypothetical protein
MSFWVETEIGLVLAIKAHPGAKRVKIGPVIAAASSPGWPESRLKISVAAPPEDGRANEAILQALADWLRIKPAAITQEAGATARDKKFRVAGAGPGDFQEQFVAP